MYTKKYRDQLKEMSWSQLEDEYDILQQKGDHLTPEERWQLAEIEEEILFRQDTECTPYHWECTTEEPFQENWDELISTDQANEAWLSLAEAYIAL